MDPGVDVAGAQVAQLHGAEDGQQVVVHVLGVVGEGRRPQDLLPHRQPLREVVADAHLRLLEHSGAFRLQYPLQGLLGLVVVGEADPPARVALLVRRGKVHRVAPAAVGLILRQFRAACPQLFAFLVAAAATAVDPATGRKAVHARLLDRTVPFTFVAEGAPVTGGAQGSARHGHRAVAIDTRR